jgi:hypothetical protein
MSDKFSLFDEAESHGRKWGYSDGRYAGIVIGLIIAAAFYFLFIAKNAKYEGLTAQEWANDYYEVVDCVEDKASSNEISMDCL